MQADPWDTLREPPRQLQREEHSSVEDLAGFLAETEMRNFEAN